MDKRDGPVSPRNFLVTKEPKEEKGKILNKSL